MFDFTNKNEDESKPKFNFNDYKFNYDDPITEDDFYLYHGDTGVVGPGDIMLVTGREKSRKSFFLSALLASNYTRDSSRTLGFNMDIGNKHIIVFDTEHSTNQFGKIQKKFIHSTGHRGNIPTYHAFQLRKFDYIERMEFIQSVIQSFEDNGMDIGFIIIDQIADMVSDINNEKSVNDFKSWAMQVAEEKGIVLVCVLHTNRGGQESLGKLGSAIDKKMTSGFLVSYDQETKISCAENVRARNRPLDNGICFRHNEQGYMELVEEFDY